MARLARLSRQEHFANLRLKSGPARGFSLDRGLGMTAQVTVKLYASLMDYLPPGADGMEWYLQTLYLNLTSGFLLGPGGALIVVHPSF